MIAEPTRDAAKETAAPAPIVITEEANRIAEPGQTRRRRGRRRLLLVGGCLAVIAAVVAAVTIAGRLKPSDDGGLVGSSAPSFSIPGLVAGSSDVSLDAFRGRPLVINFWASWCVPCRREMPDLQAAHVLLGDAVGFVGIDHQDDRTSALEFVQYTGVTYPSGFDPSGTVAAEYGLVGLPTTVLVSPDGQVVAEVKGALTTERLLKLVSERLGISTGS